MLSGRYADDVQDLLREAGAEEAVHEGDLAQIAEPLDFLGVNYYFGVEVAAGRRPEERPPSRFPLAEDVVLIEPVGPTTAMGWEINPEALRGLLDRLHDEHPGLPLVITENGSAFDEVVGPHGVDDPERIDYLDRHLRVAAQAIAAGVPLQGYFAWSLLDNFEWALGYEKRFGLVRVDYATQERRVKESGRWYADVIANRALR